MNRPLLNQASHRKLKDVRLPEYEKLKHKLIRVGTKHPIVTVINTDNYFGVYTHFTPKTKTVPCEHDVCDLCKSGSRRRWYCYVGMFSPKTLKHQVLELTENCAPSLAAYLEKHGTLRGAWLKAWRDEGESKAVKHNSPVSCELKPQVDVSVRQMPEPVDLESYLANMWRVRPASIVSLEDELAKLSPEEIQLLLARVKRSAEIEKETPTFARYDENDDDEGEPDSDDDVEDDPEEAKGRNGHASLPR